MTQKHSLLAPRSIAVILTAVGFVITGILAFPYGIHWDSANIIAHIVNNDYLYTNWMGWYYPLLWQTLYSVTNIPHVIGVLHNVLYWGAMLLVIMSLRRCTYKSVLVWALFAFFPSNLLFLCNITNNVLLYTSLLFALCYYLYYLKHKSPLHLVLILLTLLHCSLLRVDAFIAVLPIGTLILYHNTPFIKRKSMRLSVSCFIVLLPLLLSKFSERIISNNNPEFDQLHSIELIALDDLTGMSYYKNELLWPDEIIKVQYRGKRDSILQTIKRCSPRTDFEPNNLYDDGQVFIHNGVSRFLETESHWKPGIKDFFPTYFSNIWCYIQYRGGLIWCDLFRHSVMIYDYDPTLQALYHQKNRPGWLLWVELFSRRALSNRPIWLFLILFVLMAMDTRRRIRYSSPIQRLFCRTIVASCLVAIVISLFSMVSPQPRYIYPFLLIAIGTYLYARFLGRETTSFNEKQL